MKASKARRIAIRAATMARLNARGPMTFGTIDIVTGFDGPPAYLSIPVDMQAFRETGRVQVDLSRMGFRLVRIEG